MKKFMEPEVSVMTFAVEDVVTTSIVTPGGDSSESGATPED